MSSIDGMPTDGADFGRMKSCYGKVYTALRAGADDSHVADLIVCGIERDIRRDGGIPAFEPAVKLVVLISGKAAGGAQQLLRNIDQLARLHGDSSLSRHVLNAAEKVGMAALSEGTTLSQQEAAERILAHIGRSRCEGTSGYVTKHRTQSIAATDALIRSVSKEVSSSPALSDLASRLLTPTEKGLPAKAARLPHIEHSAESLNNTSLEGGIGS